MPGVSTKKGIDSEQERKANDAYIDYKKALEIYPDNSNLQNVVVRLAAELNMEDDLRKFSNAYGQSRVKSIISSLSSSNSGDLVVLYEEGYVPHRREMKISLATEVGLIAIAFPIYSASWTTPSPLEILDGEKVLGATEPVAHVRALAVKSLEEEASSIFLRQALRFAAKMAAQKIVVEAAKNAEGKKKGKKAGILELVAEVGTSLYNLASEKADVRNWLTLPADAHIFIKRLPAGEHKITLSEKGKGPLVESNVTITNGGKTILICTNDGKNLHISNVRFDANNASIASMQ